MKYTEKTQTFAVRLKRKDGTGTPHLATGDQGTATFYNRKSATEFKDALAPHLPESTLRVVRVKVKYTWTES
jgi:hypothetical protein